jgi:hypothetical protein
MNEIVRKIWRSSGFYILWLFSAGLGMVDILVAWTVLQAVAVKLGASRWSLPAVRNFSIVALGILWLVIIYLCEARYRKDAAVGMGRLARRFAWVTGVEVGFLVLANLALLLIL